MRRGTNNRPSNLELVTRRAKLAEGGRARLRLFRTGRRGDGKLTDDDVFKTIKLGRKKQLETLKTLRLGKIGRTTQREDHPTVRGLVHAVQHLVKVDE